MSWSIPILRVAGTQLRIHVTFLLLIGWLAISSASAAVFVLLLFLCVVLHEFGHAIAAKGYGINTPDITLLPIGGDAGGIQTSGLRYPLQGEALAMGRSRGLSNVAMESRATVSVESGTLLVIETRQEGVSE